MDAAASILLIAGVALGGRASLLGPAIGALAVGYGSTYLSESFPNQWTYFQGALFIVVILLLPGGLSSLATKLRGASPDWLAKLRRSGSESTTEAEAEAVVVA